MNEEQLKEKFQFMSDVFASAGLTGLLGLLSGMKIAMEYPGYCEALIEAFAKVYSSGPNASTMVRTLQTQLPMDDL